MICFLYLKEAPFQSLQELKITNFKQQHKHLGECPPTAGSQVANFSVQVGIDQAPMALDFDSLLKGWCLDYGFMQEGLLCCLDYGSLLKGCCLDYGFLQEGLAAWIMALCRRVCCLDYGSL